MAVDNLELIVGLLLLLQVWDGTKCAHPMLNVAVAPDALEGGSSPSQDRKNMVANVLVFDNHVEGASKLKVSMEEKKKHFQWSE